MTLDPTNESAGRSTRRRLLLTLIAVALPVLFFLLLEAGLRSAGYGNRYPLFIDHPAHPEFRLPNPDVVKRYFGDPARAPGMRIETVYFKAHKPERGLRLVVQGGSSAAGFPYGFGASLTGMLEQRLRRTHPHREIEVINTAMSAVNSYTLLDFADEIIAIAPDAVLIYAGHNEYLGILGVGSAYLGGNSAALTRAYLALRKLRLFQLLQSTYASVTPQAASRGQLETRGQTMMSRVAANKQIALGSPAFRQGVRQYRHNLEALVARYVQAGIAVYVGTLVSNERDQPPFVSGLAASTDADEWRRRYEAISTPVTAGAAENVEAARALVATDDRSADAWFLLGRVADEADDPDLARHAYQAARDRDELRFRAPGVFNEIVASLAPMGARIVSVDARLRAESPQQIHDNSLLLEHVHFNLRGYFLLADAFHDALVEDGLPGPPGAVIDEDQAWREAPLSEVDRLFGEYKIELIKANWPFSEAGGEPALPDPDSVPALLARQLYDQATDWTSAHRRLGEHYRANGQRDDYTRVALILADAFPFRAPFLFDAGVALIEAGRARQAVGYLYRGAQLAPRDVDLLLALSHALVLIGAEEQATEVLGRVVVLDPGNQTAAEALKQLR